MTSVSTTPINISPTCTMTTGTAIETSARHSDADATRSSDTGSASSVIREISRVDFRRAQPLLESPLSTGSGVVMSAPRYRTALVATLLLVPVIAGGFLLQDPPPRANAR